MKRELRRANITIDKELDGIIDDIIGNCESCIVHKKSSPKPIVGFSKAKDFNEVVSMDLHKIEGICITSMSWMSTPGLAMLLF